MTVLRNGKSAGAQLLIKDFNTGEDAARTLFTLADEVPSPVPATIGTCDVTNGSAVVTNLSVDPNTNLEVGAGFFVIGDTEQYIVQSIDSATQITLTSNYNGGTVVGASYTRSNFTNDQTTDLASTGKLNCLMLGNGTESPLDTHTGLKAEHTHSSLKRKIDGDIVSFLENDETTNDAWNLHLRTLFNVGVDESVSEGGAGSNPEATAKTGTGICWGRVTWTSEPVEVGELFEFHYTLKLTGELTVTGNQKVLPYDAMIAFLRLWCDRNTARRGATGIAGDWSPDSGDGSGYGADDSRLNGIETQFDFLAISDDATTLARNITTLAGEHVASDSARRGDGTDGKDCRGTLMENHATTPTTFSWNGIDDNTDTTAGNEGQAFQAATFTNHAGDTVQLAGRWDLLSNTTVTKIAWFNKQSGGKIGPTVKLQSAREFDGGNGHLVGILRVVMT